MVGPLAGEEEEPVEAEGGTLPPTGGGRDAAVEAGGADTGGEADSPTRFTLLFPDGGGR